MPAWSLMTSRSVASRNRPSPVLANTWLVRKSDAMSRSRSPSASMSAKFGVNELSLRNAGARIWSSWGSEESTSVSAMRDWTL